MQQMDVEFQENLQQTEKRRHLLDLLNKLYQSNKQRSKKTVIKSYIQDIRVANLRKNGHQASMSNLLDHLDHCVCPKGCHGGKGKGIS